MPSISESLYKTISDFGLRHSQIVAVYVFGSTATERYRAGSDIDIAIMVRGSLEKMERVNLETSLSNLLERDVDLVIFGNVTPLLQHEILRNGHLLFESDAKERVRQEVAARFEYLESLSLYRVIEG